jgi:hypothetical protein
MIVASLALVLAVSSPPAILAESAATLTQIDRMASLPAAIRAGTFTVDGRSAAGWQISDPGGPFSATDQPIPGAPGRRLIFAACNARLCAIHYERGGVAHFYEVLVLERSSGSWSAVWNVYGPKPLANLAALQSLVEHPANYPTWYVNSVKGDF